MIFFASMELPNSDPGAKKADSTGYETLAIMPSGQLLMAWFLE